MGLYNPSASIEHASGDDYEIHTTVEVADQETIQLESNNVTGNTRLVIYAVQATGGGNGNHTENRSLGVERQTGEDQVTVEIKKGGVIKGTTTVDY